MSKELVTTSPKKKKKSLKPPKTLTQSLECVLHGTIEKHERTLFPPILPLKSYMGSIPIWSS